MGFASRVQLKLTAVGVRLFFYSKGLVFYQLRWPWRGKLLHPDHVTVPVAGLRAAEDFYVGLLAAQVVLRLDAALLQHMGWAAEDIEKICSSIRSDVPSRRLQCTRT